MTTEALADPAGEAQGRNPDQARDGGRDDPRGDPRDDPRDRGLEELPGGVPPLRTIHDSLAADMLALAERQVAEARQRLGAQASKPRLKSIDALFRARAGSEPGVSEELERAMRSPQLAQQTATSDAACDIALARAYNEFDHAAIGVGSQLQTAHDDWLMAVRLYRSAEREQGAILEAAIELTDSGGKAGGYEQRSPADALVRHFDRSSQISAALVTYEKAMQAAGTDLAKAFGTMNGALYIQMCALAVAEATLIDALQKAYDTFWTAVDHSIQVFHA
ncbi:MAG: hypothetical protein KGM17_12300 [Sphingomonadales bacterium]|nr:hypothetical protein [Sphingomonadales bacterium]